MICELTFQPKRRTTTSRDELDDAVVMLMAGLQRGGQIWGDELRGWRGTKLVVYCRVPTADALAVRFMLDLARRDWEKAAALCTGPPAMRLVSGPARRRTVEWKRQRGLYLFTHAFDSTSPVCAGTDGRPVPTYVLPIDEPTRQGLEHWAQTYKDYDRVWLHSGPLEEAAYRQLASPGSELTREGRELCAEIEKATGLPTYYHLHRYHAFLRDERRRRCPGCKGRWRRVRTQPEYEGLGGFEFRCDRCRLVSVQGPDVGSAKLARIGGIRP